MKELLLQILTFLYLGGGIIAAIGYMPTIIDLYHKKPSANVNSYILWAGTAVVTFLYCLFVLPDLYFRIVSTISFTACSTVLILAINLQRCNKK